jgi:two-component system, NtrC family, sensor kinase
MLSATSTPSVSPELQETEQSRQILQQILDTMPHMVFWKDRDLVFQGCNILALTACGLSSVQEIIGTTDYDLPCTKKEADLYRLCDRRVMESGQAELNITETQRRANGETVILNTNKVPLRDTAGNVTGILVTIEDITDRKAAEAALIESETKFRRLVEDANDLICVWNLDSTITYISPRFTDFSGYTIEEFIGQSFGPLVHPDDLPGVIQFNQEVAASGEKSREFEFRQIHRNGEIYWTSVSITPIKNNCGETTAFQGILKNITDRKIAEIQLKRQTLELEQAFKELQSTQTQLVQSEKMSSLGQLIAGVAHEINNPVNFIYGNLTYAAEYTETLMELLADYQKALPKPHQDLTAKLERSDLNFIFQDLPRLIKSMKVGAERIQEIVLSLRNFSRLDESDYKEADIHDGIDSTLMILEHRLKAQDGRPSIQIVKNYSNFPRINCYAGQLNQVFMNVIANAVDALEEHIQAGFSETPAIAITTTMQTQGMIITISDNGPGIPDHVKQRLFDPFFTTKAIGKGTGLGLSISYQVVTEKHRGTLTCQSALGQGTQFVITLPKE